MRVPEGTDDADCRWAAMSAPEGAAHAYMHAGTVPTGAMMKTVGGQRRAHRRVLRTHDMHAELMPEGTTMRVAGGHRGAHRRLLHTHVMHVIHIGCRR